MRGRLSDHHTILLADKLTRSTGERCPTIRYPRGTTTPGRGFSFAPAVLDCASTLLEPEVIE
jgi:hypothetical protein